MEDNFHIKRCFFLKIIFKLDQFSIFLVDLCI